MDLHNTIQLDNLDDTVLRDLAGALIGEADAVDWDGVLDTLTDELGGKTAHYLAAFSLGGYHSISGEPQNTILTAVIQSASTNAAEVNYTLHESNGASHSERVPGDDGGFEINWLEIHGIRIDASDLTYEGIQACVRCASFAEGWCIVRDPFVPATRGAA